MKKIIVLGLCLLANAPFLTAQKPQSHSHSNSQSSFQSNSSSRPQGNSQSRPQNNSQSRPQNNSQSRPQSNSQVVIQTTPQSSSQSRPQTASQSSTPIPGGYSLNGVEQCVIEAIYYLNSVRKNPSAFSEQIGADLGYVQARPMLKVNESLMKAAQAKAEDMANRNYFAHVDPEGYGMNYRIHEAGYDIPAEWYSNKANNYVESIGCGTNMSTGKSIINLLVLDADVPSLGHRIHLLGIDEFNSTCVDIGVGHAYNPNSLYKHYWSILIAKHNY